MIRSILVIFYLGLFSTNNASILSVKNIQNIHNTVYTISFSSIFLQSLCRLPFLYNIDILCILMCVSLFIYNYRIYSDLLSRYESYNDMRKSCEKEKYNFKKSIEEKLCSDGFLKQKRSDIILELMKKVNNNENKAECIKDYDDKIAKKVYEEFIFRKVVFEVIMRDDINSDEDKKKYIEKIILDYHNNCCERISSLEWYIAKFPDSPDIIYYEDALKDDSNCSKQILSIIGDKYNDIIQQINSILADERCASYRQIIMLAEKKLNKISETFNKDREILPNITIDNAIDILSLRLKGLIALLAILVLHIFGSYFIKHVFPVIYAVIDLSFICFLIPSILYEVLIDNEKISVYMLITLSILSSVYVFYLLYKLYALHKSVSVMLLIIALIIQNLHRIGQILDKYRHYNFICSIYASNKNSIDKLIQTINAKLRMHVHQKAELMHVHQKAELAELCAWIITKNTILFFFSYKLYMLYVSLFIITLIIVDYFGILRVKQILLIDFD